MPLNPPHRLALSIPPGGEYIGQPLPAEEQLAQLFLLAGASSLSRQNDEHPTEGSISLSEAYRVCYQATRQHSKSFFFSTQLLPSEKRRSIRALYAFGRMSDDIVDHPDSDPAYALAEWVRKVQSPRAPANDPILLAWNDTCARYEIDGALVNELLAGFAMDLTITRYQTFADLWLYCYRVASVVGLLSMGVIGAAPGATSYAIKLGVALQMTNIIRDVGEDARRGRIYLPQEDLRAFGLSDDDILSGVYDDQFRALMQFQLARAHRLYDESWPGIALLPYDSRLAVGAAARVYRGILDKVAANKYDVHTKRAFLTLREKFLMLPRIWRDIRRLSSQ